MRSGAAVDAELHHRRIVLDSLARLFTSGIRHPGSSMTPRTIGRLCLALLAFAMSGCSSFGPGTVSRDRVDYLGAVSESWKEQTLLNIVRLRYGDAPTFLDVSSVISSYTFQAQASAAGQTSNAPTTTFGNIGAGALYIDRPTISYTPVAGQKFTKSLLNPIPPSSIFELTQSGFPVDRVFQVTVRALNGVYNRSSLGARSRDADPEFYPLLDALRRLQLSESVSLRLEKRGGEEVAKLIFKRSGLPPEVQQDLQFVQRALNVKPNKDGELTLTFGALPRSSDELAVLSRSMLEILLEVSAGIEVPDDHVSQGRTRPATRRADAENPRDRPLIQIHSGANAPASPFTAVRYRDTWYWVDDADLGSKSIFAFLMMFFSLAETGVTPQAPVLTLPAS
jgi:hypothetical protein